MSLLLALTGGGPVGIPVVAADTAAFSDAATCFINAAATATDTAAFTDSSTASVNAVATAADTAVFSDAATCLTTAAAVAADTAAFSDSAVAAVNAVATATDTASFSDSATALSNAAATATDTVAFADSAVAARAGGVAVSAADSITVSDSAVAAKVPPGPTGGGRAWLRSWLQAQYTQDFARYERERAEKIGKAPTPRQPTVARLAEPLEISDLIEEAAQEQLSPQEIKLRVLALVARRQAVATRSRVDELLASLPVADLSASIAAAGPKLAAPRDPNELEEDEVGAILLAAAALGL